MSDDMEKDIQQLKQTLSALSERLRTLEQRLGERGRAPATPSAVEPSRAVSPPPPAGPSRRPKRKKPGGREDLEMKIGRYWLNRIGISSLVLGIAFFILYSFQYLGAGAKIAIGFAAGSALLATGVWSERKAGLGWFARGLLGGGWAVIYFTTYAMYHIPAVAILPSAVADFLLLTLVAIGAVWHSLKYRSQVVTALAFLLGFITLSVSHVSFFTVAASAVLVIALVSMAVRMRWHGLCLYGVLGSYFTYQFWVKGQIAMSPLFAMETGSVAVAEFWLNAAFLMLYWVAYTFGILGLDERKPRDRNALLTSTLVNGLMWIVSLMRAMEPVYADAQYLVWLGAGLVYLALSSTARIRGLSAVSTVHLLLGLTFMTLAIAERLTDRWTSFLWMAEVAALAWLGLRYDRWTYRLFAGGLGAVMFFRLFTMDLWQAEPLDVLGHAVPWRVLIGVAAVLSFGAAGAGYRIPWHRHSTRWLERQAFHLYVIAAGIVAWSLSLLEANRNILVLLWATEASALIVAGWRLKDRALRLFGAIWFVSVGFRVWYELMVQPVWWSVPATVGVIGLLVGMSLLYRAGLSGPIFQLERGLRHGYTAAAAVVLTLVLWIEVSHHWLSLAWALEGISLLAAGFLLRDRGFRFAGLAVFALLVLRILFVDLAGAETIYRILSFVVVGAILLLASFAYAKFAGTTPKARD